MNLGYVSVVMIIIAMVICGVGAFGIAKYAFRISSAKGALALLFPPYTFYFSFYELQEDGKETAISLWATGLILTIVFLIGFSGPVGMVLQGRAAELSQPSMEEQAESEFSGKAGAELPPPVAELKVDPNQKIAGVNDAPAATNNGTNGATNGATNNGTNNAAPATNNAAPAKP